MSFRVPFLGREISKMGSAVLQKIPHPDESGSEMTVLIKFCLDVILTGKLLFPESYVSRKWSFSTNSVPKLELWNEWINKSLEILS